MQNKKTKNIKIVKLFNIIFYTIIFIYFAFLVQLIGPQRHVDPDFFQFLRDSNFYLKFQLPPTIQSLPANPILIGIFSKVLSAFLTEIEVALLINAITMTAAILLVYFILKKDRDIWHAGLAILFLISNPIVFKSAVSNNSEVLFSMFSLFIFFLVWKKKILLASFLTALGILIRYESILLFISLILIDFLNKRNLVNLIKKIIVFFIPATVILTVLMTRNYSRNFLNTPFLVELFQRSGDIPELRFISNFPFTLFYNENYLYAKPNLIIIFISVIFYLLIFFLQKYNFNKNKNNNLIKTTLLFSGLFLVFHTLFPAYLERYFTPVIFSFVLSTTLAVKNLKNNFKKILIVITLVICIINFWKILPNFTVNNQYVFCSHDYSTAQSIQNKIQKDQQQYVILSPYPETLEYYYKNNSNISLISVKNIEKISNQDNLANSIVEYEKMHNTKVIIPYNNLLDWGIYGEYDNSLRSWYESIGLYRLGNFINSEKSCLWYQEGPDYDFTRVYTHCL